MYRKSLTRNGKLQTNFCPNSMSMVSDKYEARKAHKSIERLNWNFLSGRLGHFWSALEPFVGNQRRIGAQLECTLASHWCRGYFMEFPFIIRFRRSWNFLHISQVCRVRSQFSSMPLHLLNRPMPHWRHCGTLRQMIVRWRRWRKRRRKRRKRRRRSKGDKGDVDCNPTEASKLYAEPPPPLPASICLMDLYTSSLFCSQVPKTY